MINLLLAWFLLIALYSVTVITEIVVFIATVIICLRVFSYQMYHQIQQQFQLNDQGIWQWLNEEGKLECWQINGKSRVAFYGCYLMLEPCDQKSNSSILFNQVNHLETHSFKCKTLQQFIFKDSLSIKDYARLCRVIQRLNTVPIQAVLK